MTTAQQIITRTDKRLTDANGELIGWISDNNKFHPCGAALTEGQLRAILLMLAK
jgi:hypothetical protein